MFVKHLENSDMQYQRYATYKGLLKWKCNSKSNSKTFGLHPILVLLLLSYRCYGKGFIFIGKNILNAYK